MRPSQPSVSARTQQGIRSGRGACNRSCPRNRERRGPFQPCHWGDLGRRKGLTTREPGDLPTNDCCRPGGVSWKSERRETTRGLSPVGPHGASRSSIPPFPSVNETGTMTTNRAETAPLSPSTTTTRRFGANHDLRAERDARWRLLVRHGLAVADRVLELVSGTGEVVRTLLAMRGRADPGDLAGRVAAHGASDITTDGLGSIRARRFLSAATAARLRVVASWRSAFVLSARPPGAAPTMR